MSVVGCVGSLLVAGLMLSFFWHGIAGFNPPASSAGFSPQYHAEKAEAKHEEYKKYIKISVNPVVKL